jgi:hypothetical protein
MYLHSISHFTCAYKIDVFASCALFKTHILQNHVFCNLVGIKLTWISITCFSYAYTSKILPVTIISLRCYGMIINFIVLLSSCACLSSSNIAMSAIISSCMPS